MLGSLASESIILIYQHLNVQLENVRNLKEKCKYLERNCMHLDELGVGGSNASKDNPFSQDANILENDLISENDSFLQELLNEFH
jgi:hypothetical protein